MKPAGDAVTPPAVILGGSFNSVSVARSLAAQGVEVHVLADGAGGALARHSRFVSSFTPVTDSDAAWPRWLEWLADGPPGAVLLPCSDVGLEFVACHRPRLVERGFRPIEADDDVTMAMLDKATTYDLARRAGVLAPRTATVHTVAQLEEVADDFDYPCALKPRHSHRFARAFGTKAVVAGTKDALLSAFSEIAPTRLEMLVTEIVPGVDDSYCSYYTYLDECGEPLLHFTKRKLRQYPNGFGMGTYHVSAWEPEAAEVGLRFFQSVGLRGIGNVEFKRDCRDGRLKLIECNPRFTAADKLVHGAGVDLARIAYQRAIGEAVAPVPGFRTGVRQWHPLEDVQAFLDYRRAGRMATASWLASLAHLQHLPMFDWRDPGPTVAYDRAFARRVAGWLGRRARAAVGG